ncbi:MAG TPA: glycerophosphodiester phosphodiesterase, partial [Candidatus Saccharimonadaceae bacterium]|nr:glycerophosphodiester phosphodiesterase [Candidatus Saccharimonadaceae bacterium]
MLIIGHRGARGLAPENSLAAFEAGIKAGADILEFDVRLTKDKIPVVIHDIHTKRTHNVRKIVPMMTLDELRARHYSPEIMTLESLLDRYFGTIMLNIEAKRFGTGKAITELIAHKYIKQTRDWDNFYLSSFIVRELFAARRVSKYVNLALLHDLNSLRFVGVYRQLNLTAVGFHRLHTSTLALEIAKRLKIFTYAYT